MSSLCSSSSNSNSILDFKSSRRFSYTTLKSNRFRERRNGKTTVVVSSSSSSPSNDDDGSYFENDRGIRKIQKFIKDGQTVYLLVFNLGERNESIYTTSERNEKGEPLNKFVVFEEMKDAIRAAVEVSSSCLLSDSVGEPIVEGVMKEVVLFLCARSEFGVEFVRKGEVWTPPLVVVEDPVFLNKSSNSNNGDDDDSSSDDDEQLAISSADLEKYLVDGGSFRKEIEEQYANEDIEDARRIAAYTVQAAIRKPLRDITKAFQERTACLTSMKSILKRKDAITRALLEDVRKRRNNENS